jgi:hypothetical protein
MAKLISHQMQFASCGFKVSVVLHLYPVLPTTVFGFMYQWSMCTHGKKKSSRDPYLLEKELQWHPEPVF